MPLEIERKFLVRDSSWKNDGLRHVHFCQGYIKTDPARHITVRIRLAGEHAFLTLKGPAHGLGRSEFEYEIPVGDAEQMLAEFVPGGKVEKIRYYLPSPDGIWEIDEYLGDNEGLVTAELELKNEHAAFERPSWLGSEVTGIPRYLNSMLAVYPWKLWPPSERN